MSLYPALEWVGGKENNGYEADSAEGERGKSREIGTVEREGTRRVTCYMFTRRLTRLRHVFSLPCQW